MDPLAVAGIVVLIGLLMRPAAPAAPSAQTSPAGTYIALGDVRYRNVPGEGVTIAILPPSAGAGQVAQPTIASWPADIPQPTAAQSAAIAGAGTYW